MCRHLFGLLSAISLLGSVPLRADPVITSPPPANGASPSGPFVFTFSEAMNPELTAVSFTDLTTFDDLPTTAVWSSGDTVLTCTPSPAFPANRQIFWSADGENLTGDPLSDFGLFTTGSGSGGSGTNAITTFSVGKIHHYNQTSASAPTLDPSTPYGFSGVVSLSSNRTATSAQLLLPTGSLSNLTQLPLQPEIYALFVTDGSLAHYDATFPAGDYTFTVNSNSFTQMVTITLPSTSTMPQPNAPHLTNYVAAQAVDPTKPFVLGWDAFTGGTSADYIDVDIGTSYNSPNPGMPGALDGTARTLTIPAGTLQPNSTYSSRVGFFHHAGTTNSTQANDAYRSTYTEFSLVTTTGGMLLLRNPSWAAGAFSFDVLCTNGQTVTVEYTNSLTAVNWTKLLTTNSPGSSFHVVSTQAVSHPSLFYRARNGP